MWSTNMKPFIYFTDFHFTPGPISSRRDKVPETQIQKLREVFELAKKNKCEFIIHGGDFGHSHNWSTFFVNKIAKVIEEYDIPIYSIIGNHDVPGKNLDLLKDCGIYVLSKVTDKFKIIYEPIKLGGYNFVPFHSDTEETDKLINNKYTEKVSKNSIAVVHAPIGAEDTKYCKGVSTLFIPNFKYALFGDIHSGWEPFESITGCTMVNPGSLSLLTIKETARVSRVTLIHGDKIKELDIKTLEEFNSVQLPEFQDLGKNFVSNLITVEQTTNTEEYLSEVAKSNSIDLAAVKVALEYVE